MMVHAAAGSEHWKSLNYGRDFVALAVASEDDVITEEQTTGMGGNREQNMVEFARLGLVLLRKAILQRGLNSREGRI